MGAAVLAACWQSCAVERSRTLSIIITLFRGGATDCGADSALALPWERVPEFYRAAAEGAPGLAKSKAGYAIFCELRPSTRADLLAILEQRDHIDQDEIDRAARCGYRNYEHVVAVTALGVDYDENPAAQPDWRPEAWPCGVFAHSSHNWAPALEVVEGDTRGPLKWRCILPLSRAISVDEERRLRPVVQGLLPQYAVVRAPHQPAYMPTCPAGSAVQFASVEGLPLDVDALLARAASVPARMRPDVGVIPTSSKQLADRDGEVVALLSRVWADDWSSHRAFGALGGMLRREGVSPERAGAIAEALAEATCSQHADPAGRVCDESCPLGVPMLKEMLALDVGGKIAALAGGRMSVAGLVAVEIDKVERILRETTETPEVAAARKNRSEDVGPPPRAAVLTSDAEAGEADHVNDAVAVREMLEKRWEFRFNARRPNPYEYRERKLGAVWDAWSDDQTRREVERAGRLGVCGVAKGGRARNPTKMLVGDAVAVAAARTVFDPVLEYLRTLAPWDGVSRLDTLLVDHFGSEDTLLTRAAARVMMLGAVRRAHQPGCKFDICVVLMGAQGARKSGGLKALFGGSALGDAKCEEFYDDPPIDLDKPADAAKQVGAWCTEWSELDKLAKYLQAKVKAFITTQSDTVRLPYAHAPSPIPRRGIIVGTINTQEGDDSVQFLTDPTGNRRYLAAYIGATQARPVDIERLLSAREQLWAEAVARVGEDYASWLSPAEEAAQKAANAELVQEDDWEALVAHWIDKGAPGEQRLTTKTCIQTHEHTSADGVLAAPWQALLIADVLQHALGVDLRRISMVEQRRAGTVLRKLGWVRTRAHLGDGRVRCWGRIPPQVPKAGLEN